MTSVYRGWKAAVPVVVLAAAVGAGIAHRAKLVSWWAGITTPVAADSSPATAPELTGKKDALALPADVAKRLEVQTEPARPSTVPSTLELSGSLILDADRLAHVHARFPGEVVELGKAGNGSRPVAFGQHVRKGQVLAVIWSQDLGEKKSELVDALSQQRVDEETLQRLARPAAERGHSRPHHERGPTQGRSRSDRGLQGLADAAKLATFQGGNRRSAGRGHPRWSAKKRPTARNSSSSGPGSTWWRRWTAWSSSATWPSASWSTPRATCSRSPTFRGWECWPTPTRKTCPR